MTKLEAARAAALKAGEMILTRRPQDVARKGQNDYVTELDRASEDVIRAYLYGAFPEDAFYGEESGESGAGRGRWIVDPIDGTTNFIKGLPMYSVSVAYERGGTLLAGCVYAPALGEIYTAEAGGGAYRNGERILASVETDLSRAVVAMSFAHRDAANARRMFALIPKLCAQVNDLRRLGSAAYDLCCVACGRTESFLELGLHAYDIAAGTLIAREAGAVVTGWETGEDCMVTGNILAAAPALHGSLRALIRA